MLPFPSLTDISFAVGLPAFALKRLTLFLFSPLSFILSIFAFNSILTDRPRLLDSGVD
jgi:hypothetical protein